MLPYIDGMYSVYYTAGRIARKISRPAAGRIDTAINVSLTIDNILHYGYETNKRHRN